MRQMRRYIIKVLTVILCGVILTVYTDIDKTYAAGNENIATNTDANEGATSDNTPQSSVDNKKTKAVTLNIDNKNKYDGMDKTYQEGYVPTVANGKAILVIPINSDGDIKDSTLKTSLNLGDAQNAPFVIKNYQKDVTLLTHKVNDGKAVASSYLIAYTLDLKSDRVNGSYPVVLSIKGEDVNGNNLQESITTYVTITDGKNPNEEPEEQLVDEGPTFAPKVLVSSYEYSKKPVIAGDEITAKITLVNTSDTNLVKNMTVTVNAPSEYLTLLSPTDTLYIESIGAGEKYLVTFKYKVSAVAPMGQYDISLSMDYADANGATYVSSGTAKLNIEQPIEVQFDKVVLPESMEVADVMELSCNAMNLGKGKVYNVRASLEIDGLIPEGTIFIGDMEPGCMMSGSTTVSVTSLKGSSSYGQTMGTITFIYEDENGQEYTVVQELSTQITSPFVNLPDPEEQDKPVQWWIIMGIIALVLVCFGATGIIAYIKRKSLDKEE